jgi:NADH-quinone oxidoreductase subunit N
MNWIAFGPELFYFLAVVLFTALAVMPAAGPRYGFAAALLVSAMGLTITLAGARLQGLLFVNTYRVDLFSQVFKVLLATGLFLVVCLCSDLKGVRRERHPEFYLLLFTCTLAMMLLVSAVHLFTVYLSLELSSYSLYILVSLHRRPTVAVEAGIKYFLVGVTASAVMLFGIALLYSVVPATYLPELGRQLAGQADRPLVLVGLLLTFGGFFFKLAVFPFHFWAPDVYQGAADQAAAYIATASKVAAAAVLLRFAALSGDGGASLARVLVVLSVVSMTVGNLAAIAQKDFKRLLAYSSIAHAGYLLIGVVSMSVEGYTAVVYYALAVLLMKFTAFLVLVTAAAGDGNLQIEQLGGLHRRSPLLAMALMIALFGLAGIPPTVGFTGKLLVFVAAVQQGYLYLVLIAMINVVVSLYYYLLVLKAAYLLEPQLPQPRLALSLPVRCLTGILVFAMVAVGIYPAPIIELARASARLLM